ncbi:hypothetical protein MNBD_PLANCTO03-149, partial [hydrothermal vent metagenome]
MTPSTPSPRETLGLKELIAIGVGGMIGGGIFSVLGLAVKVGGHAAPIAFGLGGLIAMLTAYSFIKLALTYRSDGASFTYLEHAFPAHPSAAGLLGWTVIAGYVGTLSLYAFTFGAYGADLLGSTGSVPVRLVLSTGILLFFMVVNLSGVRSSGRTEDLIVYTKLTILVLIAIAGTTSIKRDHLVPVFDHGIDAVFIAGAMIFVAYEGFELITNAICETRDPERNIPRGIYGSVIITTLLYLCIAFVAVGSLSPKELVAAEEYALAVAAEPSLGNAGRVLVAIAAMLATSSAINATAFGSSRMMSQMATEKMMPKAFSFRSRKADVPWVAIVVMTGMGIAFTLLNSLETIAAYSSLTFLLVSLCIAVANFKLHAKTHANRPLVAFAILVVLVTIGLLIRHMWTETRETLLAILIMYGAVFVMEFVFSQRSRLGRKLVRRVP